MKTVGLIGGVAWPSTLVYYRMLNEQVQAALGVPHSARCVIVTLDFAEVLQDMNEGRPQDASARMQGAAQQLKAAGAELVAILANTGHFAAEAVQKAAGVPLVHIATETARSIRVQMPQAKRLGILGTSHALKADFFMRAFSEQEGFELVLPDEHERSELDSLIFGELASGHAGAESAAVVNRICANLAARGAEGIVLGCTELAELQEWLASPVPLFDSTELHARAIVREMISA